jgi:hypothetical protein
MNHDIVWNNRRTSRAILKSYVRKFLLYPSFWEDNKKHITETLSWKSCEFSDLNKNKIPTKHGLYCFVVEPKTPNFLESNYLFYIGKASSATLRSRYKNYLNEKEGIGIGSQKPRIKVQEMLKDYEDYIHFYYVELNKTKDIILYEEKLLDQFMPYVNTKIPEATIKEEYRHIY